MKRFALLVSSLLACRPAGADREPAPSSRPTAGAVVRAPAAEPTVEAPPTEPTAATQLATPSSTAPSSTEPVLLITDRPTLAALPELSLAEVVLGHPAPSMAALSKDPAFATLLAVLRADLRRDAEDDPKAGVGPHHPHRQFDRRWLTRPNVRPELVAVVNRFDRHPFAPDHCGETRLIYRLAYDAQLPQARVHSRLPMTFNVVLWQDGPDCQQVAQRWLAPVGQDPSSRAAWLRGPQGPLSPEHLTPAHLLAVEVDLQSVRWPSAVRPGLGGHAEYTLRVFHRAGDRFVPAPLENTPDVARLRRNPALRQALVDWLTDPAHARALDEGVATLPQRFLARRARSVTPRGLARLGNRPFSSWLSAEQLASIDYSTLHYARSPVALLRRLDGLSCSGCHQSRSVAGFHVVGEDPPEQELDAVAVPISPHLAGDLDRRERYLLALARGESGSRARPLSERDARPGRYGSHCGLPGSGLTDWTCAEGLTCRALGDPQMGICTSAGRPGAGDPCEVGTLRAHADPHRDGIRQASILDCGPGAVCNDNAVGFPEGMCTASCVDLAEGEACGAIVALRPFNLCVARRRPFPSCIEANAHPAGMRACDPEHPCRDDYICARSPFDEPTGGGGVCLPPYFLFQLRVDGHVM